jgi:hypothetical protein
MFLAVASDFHCLQGVAERAGYPGDAAVAIMLLFESRRPACSDEQVRTLPHILASELCDRLLQSETRSSRKTLRRLRLVTSEDVGRVAYALVKEGFLSIDGGESEADFTGLFDLHSK